MTDRFIRKDDVDPVRARLELKEADEALDKFEGVHGGPEHGELVSKELWAATQLELYGDPPPPALRGLSEFQLGSLESYTKDAEESAETTAKVPARRSTDPRFGRIRPGSKGAARAPRPAAEAALRSELSGRHRARRQNRAPWPRRRRAAAWWRSAQGSEP